MFLKFQEVLKKWSVGTVHVFQDVNIEKTRVFPFYSSCLLGKAP